MPPVPSNFPSADGRPLEKDGRFTREWLYLFLALFKRTGSGTGAPGSVTTAIDAAGTTQATAQEIASDYNEVLTASAGTGVRMFPTIQPGYSQAVYNGTGSSINVYPPVGFYMDASLNTAYSLANGKTQVFTCYSQTQIRSFQIG